MDWTFIVGIVCGALGVVGVEAMMIIVWVLKGIKEGCIDEKSERHS